MPDTHDTVWMCMVSMRWGHVPFSRCSSPLIHPNCGWYAIQSNPDHRQDTAA